MPEIKMHRKDYSVSSNSCEHPGLMLERGFDRWTTEKNQYNEQKKAFYDQQAWVSTQKQPVGMDTLKTIQKINRPLIE